jgi:ketosteroid isomerase-like protein
MLSWFVRRRVHRVFAAITNGDWGEAVRGLSHDVHHVFPGRHPLGGERHDRAAVERWFSRLGRLFPGHSFEVHRVAVTGPPWRMAVAVQWTAQLRPAIGHEYENQGAHWLELTWFRVTAFHAYLDTALVESACAVMAAAGLSEAAAEPIT